MTDNRQNIEERKAKHEGSFRFAESCLYGYQGNLARLERLRADLENLSSRMVTNYEAEEHSEGTYNNPVLNYVQQREANEAGIAGLEQKTKPITRLKADLEAPYVLEGSPYWNMAEILRLLYFGNNSKHDVALKLNMSERNFRYLKTALVKKAICYLGY